MYFQSLQLFRNNGFKYHTKHDGVEKPDKSSLFQPEIWTRLKVRALTLSALAETFYITRVCVVYGKSNTLLFPTVRKSNKETWKINEILNSATTKTTLWNRFIADYGRTGQLVVYFSLTFCWAVEPDCFLHYCLHHFIPAVLLFTTAAKSLYYFCQLLRRYCSMAFYKYLLVFYCHLNRSMYPHSFLKYQNCICCQ